MPDTFAYLYLHALTGLHPGSGTAIGTVDLPVQRERHTQWPMIPGSTLKGVLRDAMRQKLDDTSLFTTFGPESPDADKHAGAFSITDARILAFPVRSLNGVFAWVTCPATLSRYKRDLNLSKVKVNWKIPSIEADALIVDKSPLLIDAEQIILEEFDFTCKGGAQDIADFIADNAIQDEATRNTFKKNLVIVHDDQFTYFVRYATEVNTRIALNYETKTVRTGALFNQEFLPAESLFYALAMISNSRNPESDADASKIFCWVKGMLPDILQVGGDETIGKGFCAVKLNGGNNG